MRVLDLEPHDFAEPPLEHLLLDHLEQVFGFVGGREIEIRVARDPERVPPEDLHPGEQRAEIGADHLLERARSDSARPNGTQRGRLLGTLTRAKCSAPLTGSRISTASESDRLEMYGNGCPGSTASGVSTGNTCDSKKLSTVSHSAGERSAIDTRRTPRAASAGSTRWCRQICDFGELLVDAAALIAVSCSDGHQPVRRRTALTPARTCRRSPATRTM